MSYNFLQDDKPLFTNIETMVTKTPEAFTESSHAGIGESVFSPLAAPFHSRISNNSELMNPAQPQEPRAADTAPTSNIKDLDQMMNMRIGSSSIQFDEAEQNQQNYFSESQPLGGRTESNIWGESSSNSSSGARAGEMIDTFDFFVKSISSANNYVSMLTREQLSVLRAIRPGLLYEFLQEVVKVRSDKRLRRALPNECAFCKNNGENEECYSSHALKDWRGRVLCPVLRAFRCPRCGATGDRAHTIKYCPENPDGGLERSGSFSARRHMGSPSSLLGYQPSAPAPSPAPSSMSHSSIWNSFGNN